jgi:hypothetical protein
MLKCLLLLMEYADYYKLLYELLLLLLTLNTYNYHSYKPVMNGHMLVVHSLCSKSND